jgi:hypothetical protein
MIGTQLGIFVLNKIQKKTERNRRRKVESYIPTEVIMAYTEKEIWEDRGKDEVINEVGTG